MTKIQNWTLQFDKKNYFRQISFASKTFKLIWRPNAWMDSLEKIIISYHFLLYLSNKQKTFMDTPVYKRVAAALKNGVFWSFCAARSSSFRLKEFFTFNESGWKEQFLHFFLCFLNVICCWFLRFFLCQNFYVLKGLYRL